MPTRRPSSPPATSGCRRGGWRRSCTRTAAKTGRRRDGRRGSGPRRPAPGRRGRGRGGTVKAVQVGEPGTARVCEVPEPRLRDPRDAIVKVTAAAICGADLFPLHGMTPGFDPGTVLGHEFTGVITEAGGGVGLLQPGQRVVSSSMTSDGTCGQCRANRPTQCASRALFGYSGVYPRLDGGQAEYVRVPMADRCLLPLPDGVGDEQALFLADTLPTGYAAVRGSGADPADAVVVLGCGPVGLMALLCAAAFGGGAIAVDGIAPRRELAAGFGAVAVSPDEAEAAVAARTGGKGADVVIEAAGKHGARHGLRGRRAFRAGLQAQRRADVRAGADAALLHRRPAQRPGAAHAHGGRREAGPGAGHLAPPAAGRGGGRLPAVRPPRGDEGGAHPVAGTRRTRATTRS